LLHFVGNAPWSDGAVLAKVRDVVLPAIERHGPVEAWIIDDTGVNAGVKMHRRAGVKMHQG
jgi:SRSO17 transposase